MLKPRPALLFADLGVVRVGPTLLRYGIPSMPQAVTARDSMAKSLYSALFDWIVLRINHALLNKKDMEESVSVSPPPPPHHPARLGRGRLCPHCHTGGWPVMSGAEAAVAIVRQEASS